jgi:hypothetical protein
LKIENFLCQEQIIIQVIDAEQFLDRVLYEIRGGYDKLRLKIGFEGVTFDQKVKNIFLNDQVFLGWDDSALYKLLTLLID